jgi:hypothetical protein
MMMTSFHLLAYNNHIQPTPLFDRDMPPARPVQPIDPIGPIRIMRRVNRPLPVLPPR